MQTVRTIVCKLEPTPDQCREMEATLHAFAVACNRVAVVCQTMSSTNRMAVQRECYHAVRAEFGLSANLTIQAIVRACVAMKATGCKPTSFDPTSVSYDARIFDYREQEGTFSLTMLHGRHRIPTVLGDFQRDALKGRKPTSATLVKRKDGGYFLHVQVKDDAPEPSPVSDHLGVDLGIAQIAVDSDGAAYSGKPVEDMRRKHNLQRKRLQRRGTKGARKKLRRISGKEARFRRHENHCISKKIVEAAKRTGRGIALENLKGIRDRVRARGGEARNRLSGWAFHQLRSFIDYKARLFGVPVVAVDPRNTSRTCSVCGHCQKSNRKSQSEFSCKACGHEANADWNAALNIRLKAQALCNGASELAIAQVSRKAAGL